MSDKQEGYTKEQLRIAFRHGCWLGLVAMDESLGPDDVTSGVVQSMNDWFEDWFKEVELKPGFTATGATKNAKDSENPEQEEDKSQDAENGANDPTYSAKWAWDENRDAPKD